jgi:hypothetical protein
MSFSFTNGQAIVSVDQDTEGALARSLHQATQPLTVIHGTLELALLTANTMEKYRDAVELSLEELKRVTDCFRDLRAIICQPQPALPNVVTSPIAKSGPGDPQAPGCFGGSLQVSSTKYSAKWSDRKAELVNVWSNCESPLIVS